MQTGPVERGSGSVDDGAQSSFENVRSRASRAARSWQPVALKEIPISQSQVIALEEQGWEAFSSSGEAARAFYEGVLARTVVMLLPGGLVLDDRAAIVNSMSGQPWSSHELEDVRSFQPTGDTVIVTYGVVARRNEHEYSALMSSVYVRRDDGWRLTFHRQSPR
jgi:hypothetical protein